jgi:hypothetical protein
LEEALIEELAAHGLHLTAAERVAKHRPSRNDGVRPEHHARRRSWVNGYARNAEPAVEQVLHPHSAGGVIVVFSCWGAWKAAEG